MTRSREQRISVEGVSLKLADLRWLVEETKFWKADSPVEVRLNPPDRPFDVAAVTVEVVGTELVPEEKKPA